eukprot:TRINITY_DN687_c0_g1_i1.p1 TRINITY_DN687_c0_g1~~TRINITY_DN687_c0_g1_i1.p1  ORF type:complete len:674 (+),score=148.37 TRINITY_DN687_c0_g1_i1:27-2048(+)
MDSNDQYILSLRKIYKSADAEHYIHQILEDFEKDDETRENIIVSLKAYLDNSKSFFSNKHLILFEDLLTKLDVSKFPEKIKELINIYPKFFRRVLKTAQKNEILALDSNQTIALWFNDLFSKENMNLFQKTADFAFENLASIEHYLPMGTREKLKLEVAKDKADILWYSLYRQNLCDVLIDDRKDSLDEYLRYSCSMRYGDSQWGHEEKLAEFRKFNLIENDEKLVDLPVINNNLKWLTVVIDLNSIIYSRPIEPGKTDEEELNTETQSSESTVVSLNEAFKRFDILAKKLNHLFCGNSLRNKNTPTFNTAFTFDKSRSEDKPCYNDYYHLNEMQFLDGYVESKQNPKQEWEKRNQIQRNFFNKLGYIYKHQPLNLAIYNFESRNRQRRGQPKAGLFPHDTFHTDAINTAWSQRSYYHDLKRTIRFLKENGARVVVASKKSLYETLCDLMIFGWADSIEIDDIFTLKQNVSDKIIKKVRSGTYGIFCEGQIWFSGNPRMLSEFQKIFSGDYPQEFFDISDLHIFKEYLQLFLYNNPKILENADKPRTEDYNSYEQQNINYDQQPMSIYNHPPPVHAPPPSDMYGNPYAPPMYTPGPGPRDMYGNPYGPVPGPNPHTMYPGPSGYPSHGMPPQYSYPSQRHDEYYQRQRYPPKKAPELYNNNWKYDNYRRKKNY